MNRHSSFIALCLRFHSLHLMDDQCTSAHPGAEGLPTQTARGCQSRCWAILTPVLITVIVASVFPSPASLQPLTTWHLAHAILLPGNMAVPEGAPQGCVLEWFNTFLNAAFKVTDTALIVAGLHRLPISTVLLSLLPVQMYKTCFYCISIR